jgi:hypothetical protein
MFNKDRSNKIIKACGTTLVSLLFFVLVPLSSAQAQVKGKLDVSTYQVPNGYTAAQSTSAARSFVKRYGNDKFSIITIYASTSSFGNSTTDFSRRWKQLIGDIATEKTLPKIEQATDKNVKIATGVGAVNFQGVNAAAALTTLTVNGRLITISCVFNDERGSKDYQAFMEGLDLDDALVNQTATATNKPSTISQKPNVAATQTGSSQSLLGKWNAFETRYSSGFYLFHSDGSFQSTVLGRATLTPGRYQVSGNTLKLFYTKGLPRANDNKEYSYSFRFGKLDLYNGKVQNYLFLTQLGEQEEVRYVKKDAN